MKITTPALIFDEKTLEYNTITTHATLDIAKCNLFYSVKACSVPNVLQTLNKLVHGFSCSTFNEVKLAHQESNNNSLQLVGPWIETQKLKKYGEYLNYIIFNSLPQWKQFSTQIPSHVQQGIRINTQLSFVRLEEYDPCRWGSKLGVPIYELAKLQPQDLINIKGLHFHTNSYVHDFACLLATIKHLASVIPHLLRHVKWINLGGGYDQRSATHIEAFFEGVQLLREEFNLDVFVEPGYFMVSEAGKVKTTVCDIFTVDSNQVVILDTTIYHLGWLASYNPYIQVKESSSSGSYSYNLSGCSCSPGDVFGQYRFDEPLKIGSQLTFLNMGGYGLSKVTRFSGIEAPSVYWKDKTGSLTLLYKDSFENYVTHLGGTKC
jgi:carboxynorspermidine decarboxylase